MTEIERIARYFKYAGNWVTGTNRQLQVILTTAIFIVCVEFLVYFLQCNTNSKLDATCSTIAASMTCLFTCIISSISLMIVMQALEDDQAYHFYFLGIWFAVSFGLFVGGFWIFEVSLVIFIIDYERPWCELAFFVLNLTLFGFFIIISICAYVFGRKTRTAVMIYLDREYEL